MSINLNNQENAPFFLNRASSTPLYLQVKEQIKYLILTGKLLPGSKLPSGRQFADFLQINRATINNALDELENEGYLKTEKGIGTYVLEHPSIVIERDHEKFKEIILNAIAEVRKLGFNTDEFVTGAFVQAEFMRTSQSNEDFYAVFIECNEPVLAGYKHEIENSLNFKIVPLLIDQLVNMDLNTLQIINKAGLIITTFTHFHEVRSLLKNNPVEIIGITAGPYLEVLFKLSKLKDNAKIAVVMVTNRGAREVAHSIQDSGVRLQSLSITSYEEKERMIREIEKAEFIIVSSAIVDEVKEYVKEHQEIMTYENRLDSASKNMLRKVVSDLLKKE